MREEFQYHIFEILLQSSTFFCINGKELRFTLLQHFVETIFPKHSKLPFHLNIFVRSFKCDSSQRIVVKVLRQISGPIERNHFCDARKGPRLREEVEGLSVVVAVDVRLDLHGLDAARNFRRLQHQSETTVGTLADEEGADLKC